MNPSQEDDDFEYDTSDGVAPPPLFGTGAADPVNEALADDVFHGPFPVRATMMLTPLDDLLRLADVAPGMLRDLLAGRLRDDPCWAEFVARRPAFAGVAPLNAPVFSANGIERKLLDPQTHLQVLCEGRILLSGRFHAKGILGCDDANRPNVVVDRAQESAFSLLKPGGFVQDDLLDPFAKQFIVCFV